MFNNRNFIFVYLIGGKFARPAAATEGEELEGLIGVWVDEHAKKAGVLVINNRQGKDLISMISSFCFCFSPSEAFAMLQDKG
jgi:hypothetical protein